MNKDALLATIIGFGIGLILAAGVFLGPTVLRSLPQVRIPDWSTIIKKFQSTKPTQLAPTPKPNETLTIQSPLPETIEPTNETLVTGTTASESIVVIEGETSETVSYSNGDGAFAGKITLGEGKNDITVTSYSKGTVQSLTVRVYYTPDDF